MPNAYQIQYRTDWMPKSVHKLRMLEWINIYVLSSFRFITTTFIHFWRFSFSFLYLSVLEVLLDMDLLYIHVDQIRKPGQTRCATSIRNKRNTNRKKYSQYPSHANCSSRVRCAWWIQKTDSRDYNLMTSIFFHVTWCMLREDMLGRTNASETRTPTQVGHWRHLNSYLTSPQLVFTEKTEV